MTLTVRVLSALAKIFPHDDPIECPASSRLTVLRDDIVSFQIALRPESPYRTDQYFLFADSSTENRESDVFHSLRLEVVSEIGEYIHVRKVAFVPSHLPAFSVHDENYLCVEPGLYPDILYELEDETISPLIPGMWTSLWVDVEPAVDAKPGRYPVTFRFVVPDTSRVVASRNVLVEVLPAILPEQEIIHTEWFHSDCLAQYYHIDVFSEAYWLAVQNYIETAAKRGINMILTPLFTPPLDTEEGGSRLNVQLVDVRYEKGRYSFDFQRLQRWITLCLSAGIKYIEMSHLFSQWGAKYAPQITGLVEGKEEKLFGWHTPGSGKTYKAFLDAFLPALIEKLYEWNIEDRVCFHISDEPNQHNKDGYKAAKELVEEHLKNFITIDALSDYAFYKEGLVKRPVPANDHIEEFIANKTDHLWVYYCSGQILKVSNRFMAMPSFRNRVIGIQLYKFRIEGFLHWGYNFYNSQYSRKAINPYEITDADYAFPSGDAFLVYPGKDLKPIESIRFMVLHHAFNDIRALKYLESLTGRPAVMELIEGDLGSPVTFSEYPKSDDYYIQLRNRVNTAIVHALEHQGEIYEDNKH